MSAIIKCPKELRQSIKLELLEFVQYTEDMDEFDRINAWYEFEDTHPVSLRMIINEERDGYPELGVVETEEGLFVEFPVGAVYGDVIDYYPEEISNAFKELKSKYPDIGIKGLCYAYETTANFTYGSYFYCEPEDSDLTVIDHWQKCAVCGRILDTDTFYNSDQWDNEQEGDLNCICCPTCMLEYVIKGPKDKENEIVNINDSWSRELKNEELDEDEWDGDFESFSIPDYFWSMIVANKNEYLPDFIANKDRVEKLASINGILEDKKLFLSEILEKVRNSTD